MGTTSEQCHVELSSDLLASTSMVVDASMFIKLGSDVENVTELINSPTHNEHKFFFP